VWDTRRNLAASFMWKQVGLWFFSLSQNWRSRDGVWCTWHHLEGRVEIKLRTDRLIRRAASDPAILALPFSLY
jgi:hypothetical protein